MSATYESTEDYTIVISDEAVAAYQSEQRRDAAIKTKTAIFCASVLGLVVCGFVMIICRILGGTNV
jgi:hypothetical protein